MLILSMAGKLPMPFGAWRGRLELWPLGHLTLRRSKGRVQLPRPLFSYLPVKLFQLSWEGKRDSE